MHKIK